MANAFGEKLLAYRTNKELTLTSFAQMLQVSPGYLSEVEAGKKKPGWDLLIALSAQNIDMNWLIKGSEEEQLIYEFNPEKNHIPKPRYKEFSIEASIPAGIGEIKDRSDAKEVDTLDYDPETHIFLTVDRESGLSMTPLVNPGDLVLISLTSKIRNHDLVAAKWDENKGALKIISFDENNPDTIVLTSYNQMIPPIFKNRKKILVYKVVLIKKKS
jgi:transcriptional regulator with XRE-family HTH domain